MKRLMILLVAAVGSAFCMADPIELNIKPESLKASMQASGMMLLLPEFDVFLASGNGIYHKVSFHPDTFKKELAAAISSPVENDRQLKDSLSQLQTVEGKAVDSNVATGFDVIFVEYWAEWCEPCKLQMKQVKEFINENPAQKILWLKVEKDPSKLEERETKT